MATMEDFSFVLCDAQVAGFPIRYVSPGFSKLFGYSADECLGKKCGDVVGGNTSSVEDLSQAAEQVGMSPTDVSAALKKMALRAGRDVEHLARSDSGDGPDADRHGFTVVANRAKDGTLIPCELDMRMVRHPGLGWTYCVGVQHDISSELNIRSLLHASLGGVATLEAIIEDRWMRSGSRRRQLLMSPASQNHLNETSAKMWHSIVSSTLRDSHLASSKAKRSKVPSLASQSTASGGSVISAVSSTYTVGRLGQNRGTWLQQERSTMTRVEETRPQRIAETVGDRFMDLLMASGEEHEEGDRTVSSSFASLREAKEATFPAGGVEPGVMHAVMDPQLFTSSSLPLALLDPMWKSSPIVACTSSFAALFRQSSEDILGRPLGPMESSVSSLMDSAREGAWHGAQEFRGQILPEGEVIEVQHLARGSCTSDVTCLSYFKQVELDGRMVILCIGLPQRSITAAKDADSSTLATLNEQLDGALQFLASRFWVLTAMRRQGGESIGGNSDDEWSDC